MQPLTGIVIAGGKGTRLGGRDKAFLEIDGEPIIVRTLRLFRTLFTQTVIVTLDPERFTGLGAEVTVDRYRGGGPLAGIHAGLLAARESHAFVTACDMPLLDAGVIRFLIDRMSPKIDQSPDAIVPCWDGDVEPLHAVYAVRRTPTMERCLETNRDSIRDFLSQVRVDYVAEEVLAKLTGAARSFTNINTPGDLKRLHRSHPRAGTTKTGTITTSASAGGNSLAHATHARTGG
jgi:molybdopterin-guanine dinucleotide biosynthesis protein A